MPNVIEQDNKVKLLFDIIDENGVVDLSNASGVTLTMVIGQERFIKNCVITEPLLGKCEAELLSEDIPDKGTYLLQLTVSFIDGAKFSSNINKLLVGTKL